MIFSMAAKRGGTAVTQINYIGQHSATVPSAKFVIMYVGTHCKKFVQYLLLIIMALKRRIIYLFRTNETSVSIDDGWNPDHHENCLGEPRLLKKASELCYNYQEVLSISVENSYETWWTFIYYALMPQANSAYQNSTDCRNSTQKSPDGGC